MPISVVHEELETSSACASKQHLVAKGQGGQLQSRQGKAAYSGTCYDDKKLAALGNRQLKNPCSGYKGASGLRKQVTRKVRSILADIQEA